VEIYEAMVENKAIIIGGGIAGLIAARVLCNHFAHVIVIERDSYPEEIGPRNGAPQSNHIHVLLMKGKQILIDLFPDLERSLLAKGAHRIDLIGDTRYHLATGWSVTFDSEMMTLACTRQLLEYAIRNELISNFPDVEILENTKVTGLLLSESNYYDSKRNIVGGIKTVNKHKETQENMYAELIVDASGRNSETPDWLEELGLGRPEVTRIDSYIGYSTRRFKPPSRVYCSDLDDRYQSNWKAMIIFTKPPKNPRMGIIYPVEGDEWLVGLLGIGKNYPPVKEQEFLDCLQNLAVKDIYDAIKDAKPIGPIYGYREKGSRQYHYEKMETWPENFISLGDSVSAFNPFYGQGITVSAIGAMMLDQSLHDFRKAKRKKPSLLGFANKFQKRIAKVNSFPWLLGTSEDFRWPSTEGKNPNLYVRFLQKYSYQVMLLATESQIATRSFFEMIHMLRSPLILFHPKIVLQMIWKIITNRLN
jgi:flavin-dependent dehydrogenase